MSVAGWSFGVIRAKVAPPGHAEGRSCRLSQSEHSPLERVPHMPSTGAPPPFSGLYLDDHSIQPAQTPIQNELGFFCEWLNLRSTPAYYGWGLPHGRGEAVVVVPGFMGTDLSMMELYWWLARVGYQPYYSGLGST